MLRIVGIISQLGSQGDEPIRAFAGRVIQGYLFVLVQTRQIIPVRRG